MPLRVSIEGTDLVIADLEGAEERAQDLSPWFANYLSPRLTRFFFSQFATRGATGGSPWAPLLATTVARKARQGLDPRPLVASGFYLASFAGGAGAVETIGPREYVRGSDSPVHLFHMRGTVHMVARPVIPDPFPSEEVSEWAGSLLRWIANPRTSRYPRT